MRRLFTLVLLAAAALMAAPSTSSAGGWVVVSLDSTPAVHAGDDVAIGFTVLRHGVTPESSDDLAIVVTSADGDVQRFAAVAQGARGHHVATVRLDEAGHYDWKVTGPFVDAEIGTLDVAAPSSSPSTSSWTVVQWGSASLAVALAALAGLDVARDRRTQRTAAPVA